MSETTSFFEQFMPHGQCYLWKPEILWLNVLSDGAIAAAYFSIPIALLYLRRSRPDFPFNWMIDLFSAFILVCGATHLMAIWNVWHGDYGVQGLLKMVTAIVSVATAVALVPLIPRILAVRSATEYATANAALEAEIAERQRGDQQRRRLQQELSQVTRVNTMGAMASGFAHEVNQPLTAATQYCDAALVTARSKKVSPDVLELIEDAYEQAQRAGEIIRRMRQFIQTGETERTGVDVNDIITQTHRLAEPVAQDNAVNVQLAIDEKLPHVMVDRVQITQVLMNLITNAVDAISATKPEARTITIASKLDEKNRVEISVHDTGTDQATEEEMFRPFSTSKSEGMGIGLSISRSIIEAHDGKIWLDPDCNDGTMLRFFLPVATAKAKA